MLSSFWSHPTPRPIHASVHLSIHPSIHHAHINLWVYLHFYHLILLYSSLCSPSFHLLTEAFIPYSTPSVNLHSICLLPLPPSYFVPLNPDNHYFRLTEENVCGIFFYLGVHYWYDLHEDMSCDNFFPVFLLYNRNKLNGFGWGIPLRETSPRFEHPPMDKLGVSANLVDSKTHLR